jgi:hypothetical protein
MIEQAKDKMTLSDFNPNDHLNEIQKDRGKDAERDRHDITGFGV